MAIIKLKFNKHKYLKNNLINIENAKTHKIDRRKQRTSGFDDLKNIYIFFSSFTLGFVRGYD